MPVCESINRGFVGYLREPAKGAVTEKGHQVAACTFVLPRLLADILARLLKHLHINQYLVHIWYQSRLTLDDHVDILVSKQLRTMYPVPRGVPICYHRIGTTTLL